MIMLFCLFHINTLSQLLHSISWKDDRRRKWNSPSVMIEFFLPNSRAPLMGLIFPRWGFALPRIPPPTSVLYSAVTNPFRENVRTQNTPNPTPKHLSSWPEVQSGKNELPSGQNGPQLGQCLKIGQNFSRSGQKKIVHPSVLRSSWEKNSAAPLENGYFLKKKWQQTINPMVRIHNQKIQINLYFWSPSAGSRSWAGQKVTTYKILRNFGADNYSATKNFTSTLVILSSKIEIQTTSPEVKGLLMQAGYLTDHRTVKEFALVVRCWL